LTDPDRLLPGGLTVGVLADDEFDQLAAASQRALEIDEGIEADCGFDYLLTMLALQAGPSYKGGSARRGGPMWSTSSSSSWPTQLRLPGSTTMVVRQNAIRGEPVSARRSCAGDARGTRR
jgi:hypothetical protein